MQAVFVMGVAIGVFVVIGLLGGADDEPDPAATEQYERWRSECMVIATDELDRSRYAVGGNHWIDAVNECLIDKATD